MTESGNRYAVRPVYVARNMTVADGKLLDVVEPPGDHQMSDLAGMIGVLHAGAFVIPGKSHWFLVYSEAERARLLGYVEIIEEAGSKWSYGHIHIIDPDAAKTVFGFIRDAAEKIGKSIDDEHPDHGWYA